MDFEIHTCFGVAQQHTKGGKRAPNYEQPL